MYIIECIIEVRIKHYTTLELYKSKKYNHCVNDDFPNTFLVVQMQSITLAGSPVF